MSLLAIAFSELKRPDRTDFTGFSSTVVVVVDVVVVDVVAVVLVVVDFILGKVHFGSFSPLIKVV